MRPGEGGSSLEYGRVGCCALSAHRPWACRPAAGPGKLGRRALGTLLPPCGAPAPSKCCRNKKQRPLRPGEGRERQGEREGGNKASAARARCSSLYLLAAFAPTPAGPRRPPGEQKRPTAHHVAFRRAAWALLVNAASPRGCPVDPPSSAPR